MGSFFRLVKLKPHFIDQYNENLNTEDQIFKPQSNKTFIKAMERELKQQGDLSDNQ